jgi:hypothetical protein
MVKVVVVEMVREGLGVRDGRMIRLTSAASLWVAWAEWRRALPFAECTYRDR